MGGPGLSLACLHLHLFLQAALRDKLLQDHSVLAAFLTGLRMYLEDPTKVTQLGFDVFFLHASRC